MNRVLANRYHLLCSLRPPGRNEQVWAALDENARGGRSLVIIEQIPPVEEVLQRIADDVQRAAQLGNPVFSQVYGLEQEGDDFLVVRELVAGETLGSIFERLITREQSFSTATAINIIATVTGALARAHQDSSRTGDGSVLVHDNINPHSVVIDLDGNVRILDLGLGAHRMRHYQRSDMLTIDQLAYLSPEQCMGRWGQPQNDVFSLGVLLWEMITGRRLFDKSDEFDLMEAICDEDVPAPSSFNAETPPYLDSLTRKALARPMDKRFGDAETMKRSLDRLSQSLEPSAHTDLAKRLETLFPNRISRWRSLLRVAGLDRKADTTRLVESLYAKYDETKAGDQQVTALMPRRQPSKKGTEPDPIVDEETNPTQSTLERDHPPIGIDWDTAGTETVPDQGTATIPTEGTPTDWGGRKRKRTRPGGLTLDVPDTEQTETDVYVPPEQSSENDLGSSLGDELSDLFDDEDLFAGVDERASVDSDESDPLHRPPQLVAGAEPSDPVTQEVTVDMADPEKPDPQAEGRPQQWATSEKTIQRRPGTGPEAAPQESKAAPEAAEKSKKADAANEAKTKEVKPKRTESARPEQVGAETPSSEPGDIKQSSPTAPKLLTLLNDDEDEEDELYLSVDVGTIIDGGVDEKLVREDQRAAKPVVEIILSSTQSVLESVILRDKLFNRTFSPTDGAFSVTLKGPKAVLSLSESAAGYLRRARAEIEEPIDEGLDELILNTGDSATIQRGPLRYSIRVFYPPNPPARRSRSQLKKRGMSTAASLLAASLLHVTVIFGAIALSAQLGVTLVVEDEPAEEVFAEGELADLEELEEPDEPDEPDPVAEAPEPEPEPDPTPADPAEQEVQIPQEVREQLDSRMEDRDRSDDPDRDSADDLLAALSPDGREEDSSVSDVITNIDAVDSDETDAEFRVGGTLDSLNGDEPQIAEGGGRLSDITRDGSDSEAGRLEERERPDEVRGTVRNVQALTQVQGTLSRDEIERIINRHQGRITGCYETALNQDPTLGGQITFEWTVNADGSVNNAREQTSTMGSPGVSNCILDIIRTMDFPEPDGDSSVQIAYPFAFQSAH